MTDLEMEEAIELRFMSPSELRTEVSGLRAKLRNVRVALNTLISSIEQTYGDGEEEALDGALDADMIHQDLKDLHSLLGPDPDAVEEPCSECDPSFGCFSNPAQCSKRAPTEGGGA